LRDERSSRKNEQACEREELARHGTS
jgi:hypothetical protein